MALLEMTVGNYLNIIYLCYSSVVCPLTDFSILSQDYVIICMPQKNYFELRAILVENGNLKPCYILVSKVLKKILKEWQRIEKHLNLHGD